MFVRIAIVSSVLAAPALGAPLAAQPTGSHPSAHAAPASASLRTTPPGVTRGRSDVRVMTVIARDYAFEAPESIEAGLVDIRLENRGKEMHHIQLVRLADGKTMRDLFDALAAGGSPPAWAKDVGGPNTPVPGGTSAAMVRLKPGRYAMICFIPSPDGKPHLMKGMAKELMVTPPATIAPASAKSASPAEPRADITMTLRDYDFMLSAPLRAGNQVIRVRNEAAQSHEVVIVKLAPGKAPRDVLAWIEKQEGPPPGAPAGGTTGIARNGENILSLDLEPGRYALICFIPDAKDGKPHFVHGMVKEIEIAAR
jgi:hypothetical protein